ncbi:ATP-binding protein [Phenylobacterium aquaticum]|uniref:ATP-binding protein n=1 Tax=Phenylobacterium aquaticum TaxID=1763816 RepID=UPI0026EC9A9F|nr:ATP-binding protein [Phenylobacterium aquaticum]
MEDIEQLREALASAKQIEAAQAQRLREQDLVLSGLAALQDNDDPAKLFSRAFGLLREAVDFQHALVLAPGPEGFICRASTAPEALGEVWPMGGFFSRVANGRAAVVPDNSKPPEWASGTAFVPPPGGGVYAPISAEGGHGLLILTHAEHGVYSAHEANLVSRLGLLISQTLAAGQRRRLENERQIAVQANEAKSRFLANMSHEIRTPLNGVTTVAELLARTALDPRQGEMAALIVESGKMLERLLGDVLDFARIEAGHLAIEAAAFALEPSLAAVTELFAAKADAKGIGFRAQVDPSAQGTFQGDDLRVRQVVANLLGNAVKFTDQGEVVMTVAARDLDEDCEISVTVRDTGPGFTEAVAQRLFSRFEQGDDSITKSFAGAGLGLAISRALAQLMGGDITCSGAPGAGAEFVFTFRAPRARPVATPQVEAMADPTGDGPRVLVVEDNPNNRKIVGMILELIQAETIFAENGQEGLDAYSPHRFDAVLMDLQMPVMDGLTATRMIRERERQEGVAPIPIIVVSANAMTHHVAESLACGASAHLAKPIQPLRLIQTLAALLDPDRAEAERGAA